MKTVRKKPFGEWNVVYYDDKKTTPEKILERLKAKGCPKARMIGPTAARFGKVKASVLNPFIAPGDCISIAVSGGSEGQPSIAAPKGWTVLTGSSDNKSKTKRFYVQTPKSAKQGSHDVKVTIPRKKAPATLTLSVDIVSLVK